MCRSSPSSRPHTSVGTEGNRSGAPRAVATSSAIRTGLSTAKPIAGLRRPSPVRFSQWGAFG
jgi:hypothetical protein